MGNKKNTYAIYEHKLPTLIYKFPKLIWLVYLFHRLVLTRVRIVLKLLRKELAKDPSLSVLDVGCGEGHYCIPLAHKFKKHTILATDKNPDVLMFISDYCRLYKLNLQTRQLDINKTEKVKEVGLAYCIGVIQYLNNDALVLSFLHKSLHENGKLIINFPLKHKPVMRIKKADKTGYADVQSGIEKKYTLKQVSKLLYDNGFEGVSFTFTNRKFGTLASEVLNWNIDKIQHSRMLGSVLFSALLTFLSMPIILILNLINSFDTQTEPSGVIVSAYKKGSANRML